jgi:hypothetical protein
MSNLSYGHVVTTVYRAEIADCLEDAFGASPLSPQSLVQFATDHGARPPVIEVLSRLHEREYRKLRDLWSELADIPLEP